MHSILLFSLTHSSGFNVAEATNFAVPEWIPFGMRANFCLCRPDSVRIDMNRFISSLKQYLADQKGRRHGARLSWKEWSAKRDEERSKRKSGDEGSSGNSKKKKVKQSDQQRKKEFWIEVVKPMTATGTIAPFERKKKGGKKSKKKKKQEDEWRLAQPVKRREIQSGSRVLVILPTASIGSGGRPVALNAGNDDDSDEEEEDEECFAGEVTEIADDHARVHLDGLCRSDDVWMPISSPKLFMDGGIWDAKKEKEGIPEQHIWEEMDSKRRCVEN